MSDSRSQLANQQKLLVQKIKKTMKELSIYREIGERTGETGSLNDILEPIGSDMDDETTLINLVKFARTHYKHKEFYKKIIQDYQKLFNDNYNFNTSAESLVFSSKINAIKEDFEKTFPPSTRPLSESANTMYWKIISKSLDNQTKLYDILQYALKSINEKEKHKREQIFFKKIVANAIKEGLIEIAPCVDNHTPELIQCLKEVEARLDVIKETTSSYSDFEFFLIILKNPTMDSQMKWQNILAMASIFSKKYPPGFPWEEEERIKLQNLCLHILENNNRLLNIVGPPVYGEEKSEQKIVSTPRDIVTPVANPITSTISPEEKLPLQELLSNIEKQANQISEQIGWIQKIGGKYLFNKAIQNIIYIIKKEHLDTATKLEFIFQITQDVVSARKLDPEFDDEDLTKIDKSIEKFCQSIKPECEKLLSIRRVAEGPQLHHRVIALPSAPEMNSNLPIAPQADLLPVVEKDSVVNVPLENKNVSHSNFFQSAHSSPSLYPILNPHELPETPEPETVPPLTIHTKLSEIKIPVESKKISVPIEPVIVPCAPVIQDHNEIQEPEVEVKEPVARIEESAAEEEPGELEEREPKIEEPQAKVKPHVEKIWINPNLIADFPAVPTWSLNNNNEKSKVEAGKSEEESEAEKTKGPKSQVMIKR